MKFKKNPQKYKVSKDLMMLFRRFRCYMINSNMPHLQPMYGVIK